MHKIKAVTGIILTAAFLALSASEASAARWEHRRGPGPVLGLVGGVVVGAAAIATLPFQILGAAVNPGPPPPREYGYYGPPPGAYPPPPPPRYYRQPYGPPRGYYGYGY